MIFHRTARWRMKRRLDNCGSSGGFVTSDDRTHSPALANPEALLPDPGLKMDPFAFLKELREKVYYIPNPGNGGDSLISYATYQQLDRRNIPFEVVTCLPRFRATGRIVTYAGGGNLSSDRCRMAVI